MLDNFQWYRKWRGGIWYKVVIKQLNITYWQRNKTSQYAQEIEYYN